jgi:hypothetical protein
MFKYACLIPFNMYFSSFDNSPWILPHHSGHSSPTPHSQPQTQHVATGTQKINVAYKGDPNNPSMYFASVGRDCHVFHATSIDGLAEAIAKSEINTNQIWNVVGGNVYVRTPNGSKRIIEGSKPASNVYLHDFLQDVTWYRTKAISEKQEQAEKLMRAGDEIGYVDADYKPKPKKRRQWKPKKDQNLTSGDSRQLGSAHAQSSLSRGSGQWPIHTTLSTEDDGLTDQQRRINAIYKSMGLNPCY